MRNSHNAYLLHPNGSGAPGLTILNVPASSETSASVDADINRPDRVLLSGGFSNWRQSDDPILSPALQVNGDLGNFTREELERIALAELARVQSTSYRSTITEQENRCAVLADDPTQLTVFLETYGGILGLEPLLAGVSHPDFPTPEELAVSFREDGCTLSYALRQPVDRNRCDWCGRCGPVCPEDCLDPNLFIDPARCTMCGECVRVCPEDAIDLYRFEQREIEAAALILIGNPGIEVPPGTDRVFQADNLEPLFASFLPRQIDEIISWDATSCQFGRQRETGCTRCLSACGYGAISKSPQGIRVDHTACVECGSCVAACPTGAMQYLRCTDKQFIEWFTTAGPAPGTAVVLGNEESLQRIWWKRSAPPDTPVIFFEHPQIRTLTAAHFLFLLGMGMGRILLLDSDDLPDRLPLADQVRTANVIFSELFDTAEKIIVIAPDSLRKTGQGDTTSPLPRFFTPEVFAGRRDLLASTLSLLLHLAGERDTLLSGDSFSAFGRVECDPNRCTHCGACLNECRIGALASDPETLALQHTGILCIQCSTCAHVCPENALALHQGLYLARDFFHPRELTRAEPIVCPACGKPFGTRKSYERITAILKARDPDGAHHEVLAYCETCRVVKMFETDQHG
ncbi:MAG: hypothetical protein Kow0089_19260 [Desulfobulbaceae bacterium]